MEEEDGDEAHKLLTNGNRIRLGPNEQSPPWNEK